METFYIVERQLLGERLEGFAEVGVGRDAVVSAKVP